MEAATIPSPAEGCNLDCSKLEKRKERSGKTIARCPACAETGADSKGEHLVIFDTGKFGCSANPGDKSHRQRIFELIGIAEERKPQKVGNGKDLAVVATYDYLGADGRPVIRVCRYLDGDNRKTFRQQHWNGSMWKSGLNGTAPILFRLDKLAAADPKKTVFVVEGEKDVIELEKNHILATTASMGAGKWQDHYSDALKDRACVILPDHDNPGRDHGNAVAASLKGKAVSVKLLPLDKLWLHSEVAGPCPEFTDKHGADIGDALAKNAIYPAEIQHIAETASEWSPEAADDETAQLIESGRSLADIAKMPVDHGKTLLGPDRWLCRGARAGLIISSTGSGKSTAVTQAAVFWSLGQTAFGIEPPRPLRILTVQAENDEGDNSEAASGIFTAFNIDESERAQIAERTLSIPLRGVTGAAFLITLRAIAERWKPDLVIIDPLGVYLGDDVKNAEEAGAFLDGPAGINKLTADLDIGALIVCHTPKTNHRDTTGWNSGQWSYASAGAAVINDSTVCSLIIDQADDDGKLFKFIAGKRGGRIGWAERERFYCHGSDGIYWREATPEDMVVTGGATVQTQIDHVISKVPESGAISKTEVVALAGEKSDHLPKLGMNATRAIISIAVERGLLHEGKRGRSPLLSFQPIGQEGGAE